MDENTNKTESYDVRDLPNELTFVAIILGIGASLWLFLTVTTYPNIDFMMYGWLFILYLIPLIGVLKRRRFGFYIGLFILLINCLAALVFFSAVSLIGLFINGLALVMLMKSMDHFRKWDRVDKWAIVLFIMINVLYFGAVHYWNYIRPTPEEYYQQVSAEAIEKGDWRVCERLSGVHRNNCISSFAKSKNDFELCKEISGDTIRDYCYFDIAISLKNPQICDNIKDEYDKDMCYGEAKNKEVVP